MAPGHSREGRGHAPDAHAQAHQSRSRPAIRQQTEDRGRGQVDPHERRRQQAELGIRERQFRLNGREDREQDLPIDVVEQVDAEEEDEDLAGIAHQR